ncbi:MAG: LacI family DNA-binding transcriptional regulator [Anaerolineae bacterium]|jgi:LacI family transcriptional regulator
MSDRVTMADVAREAGVSLMTVSRVVNHKDDVSPSTRQRVLEIIEQLDYRPSGVARGLATKRTGTLGLVIPDVANPFFSDVARGAEHQAYAEGYNVFLCNTNEEPQREVTVLQLLEEKRVDGIVLCSSRLDDDELRPLLEQHSAVVLLNRRLQGEGISVVLVDDETGGRLATQHLLQAGHRAIGFLAGPATSQSGRQRARGYRAALAAVNLVYDAACVQHCAPVVEGGRQTTHELLTAHPELTALFCYNDLVAIGALQACADLGRKAPDDLAVVGYDDIPIAALVTPPLTTCRVPRYDLGVQAMRLLLKQVSGCPGDGQIVLQPELIVRASAP